MKKIIFLPIETEARELDYKIVLASQLVEQDVVCIVGQHNVLNSIVHLFNDGIYIGKNIFLDNMKSSNDIYKSYKDHNFSIFWYHEEGGIFGAGEENWKTILKEFLDPTRLAEDDLILSWGEFQKDFFKSLEPKSSIHVVGSCRFDAHKGSALRSLLEEGSRVKDRDFILINTNFSSGNHFLPDQAYFKQGQLDTSNSSINKEILKGEYHEDIKMMGYFCEMLSYLAQKNPEKKFVLRPHPTESKEIYQNTFHDFPNIKITNEYSAVEWIERCSVLIQCGCTTAVEAYFLDKPIISYYPFDTKHLVDITRDLGVLCKSPQEVNEVINRNSLELGEYPLEGGLRPLISNFNKLETSTSKITDLSKVVLKSKTKNKIDLKKIKTIIRKQAIIDLIKYYPRYLFHDKSEAYKMAKSHFPGLNFKDIDSKVKLLNSLNQNAMSIEFISKDLFILYNN